MVVRLWMRAALSWRVVSFLVMGKCAASGEQYGRGCGDRQKSLSHWIILRITFNFLLSPKYGLGVTLMGTRTSEPINLK